MKAIKYLFIGVGGILLLVLIVIAAFLVSFDANEYKQDLAQLVKQQTGRELSFQGDISLTLYPSLGMKLGAMTFANAPGFGTQPMLSVQHASVSVDLLSLLSLQPEIAQLVLDGLSVDLRTNRDGVSNWQDLVAAEEPTSTPARGTEPSAAEDGQPLTLAGAFGGLNITNASLNWVDDSAEASYQIRDLSLQSGRIATGQPFPLALTMNLSSPQQLAVDVSLTTEVLLQPHKLMLTSLQLQTSAQGAMIPVDDLQLSLGGDAEYLLNRAELAVKGFNTELQTRGGAVESAQVSLAGEIGFDVNQSRLNIAVLDLMARLQGDSIPNRSLNAGLSSARVQADLNQRTLSLEDMTLALNQDRFNGFLKVLDYAQPALQFELSAKLLDVDKLLGTPAAEPAGPAPVSETAAAEDIEIALPLELLRELQIDGQVQVNRLQVQGLSLNNVLLKLDAQQGVIDLKPLQMELYGGRFKGAVQVDARGEQPRYQVSKQLSTFQVGSFLEDFTGDDPISGEVNLELDARTGGNWLSELKANLNGDLAVEIKDGALTGFNLRHEVEKAKARFKGKTLPPQENLVTDFSAMSLSGRVVNGVFTSDDLKLQAPLLRVGGKGSVNLVEETVDYLVNSKVVGTSKGQQGAEVDELSGLLIPVAIKGPWLGPDIDVQLDEMMKARLDQEKARLREQLEQEKAEIARELEAQKAKLKANREKELAAKKAQLEAQRKLKQAEEKARLEAKIKKEKERAKEKLEEKLKKLF
ncbi:MAG: AsmA family protein [Gammaproteobacteria bacterium]|nr:AsmA family protein [Gammaproteobacteria bacterium]